MEQSPSSSGSEENKAENAESTAGYTLGGATFVSSQTEEKIGDTIGRYKLLEEIGDGGFGVVYLADQKEPLRRQVALKIIRLGMDTKQVLELFETERQALAMLGHNNNIAKVFDAGATDTGRPYFVMELIRGKNIIEYCDGRRLTVPQRLKIFEKVCHAIQYAHLKGIIHRDIKPSNILVVEENGEPEPKVIDFGIAKAMTSRPLSGENLNTTSEQSIGTPAYMSPEQAGLGGLEIDRRTDIYSLGVLLYKLLVGCLPFSPDEFKDTDLLKQAVREIVPPPPSAKLKELGEVELVNIAHCRQTEPSILLKSVNGDLNRIVMKCLEKNREQRFESASGLAAEIQRYLEGEQKVELKNENLSLPNKSKRLGWPIIAFFVGFFAIGIVAYIFVLSPMIFEHRKFIANQEIYLITDNAGHASTYEGCQAILKQIDTSKITDPDLASYVLMLERYINLYTEIGISAHFDSSWEMYKDMLISELPGSGSKVSSFRRLKEFLELNEQFSVYENLYKILGERYGTKEIKDRIAKEYPTKPK
jgi:serine/threonine protein kinase